MAVMTHDGKHTINQPMTIIVDDELEENDDVTKATTQSKEGDNEPKRIKKKENTVPKAPTPMKRSPPLFPQRLKRKWKRTNFRISSLC